MPNIEYQCPACGWTLTLPVNSKRNCPSCIEDINEQHRMLPLKEIEEESARVKARRRA